MMGRGAGYGEWDEAREERAPTAVLTSNGDRDRNGPQRHDGAPWRCVNGC